MRSKPGGTHPRLLLDVMLGRLARWLRALGHNAAYDHAADDHELLRRARRERRFLVTRDTRLTTTFRSPRIVLLHANDTPAQLRELVAALAITRHPGLLTRCIACNTRLRRAKPEEIEERAPEYVRSTQRDFRTCPGCGRLYWPGTHKRGILDALESALPGVTGEPAKVAVPGVFAFLVLCLIAISQASEKIDERGLSERTGAEPRTVVLLHGLARTSYSMSKLASALEAEGYRVCNIPYPSRGHSVSVLAAEHVAPAIRNCIGSGARPVHFVTHSLGGIVVRHLAVSEPGIRIGRVVMLGPPNRGSEVVDTLGTLSLFEMINGPAGLQLGTGADALPLVLGPPDFEVGVIAGSRTINPLLSLIIPGVDDGKVSVESARLEGMKDFLVLPASHPFLMRDDEVIEQTARFLKHGSFLHGEQPLGQAEGFEVPGP